MPLTMPQPDFEPCLALHLGAFRFLTEFEAVPHHTVQVSRATGPDDKDEDADRLRSEQEFRTGQLLMVYGDRG